MIANMSKLQSFNEEPIQPQDKQELMKNYQQFFSFIKKTELPNKTFIQGMKSLQKTTNDGNNGNNEDQGNNDSTNLLLSGGANNNKKRLTVTAMKQKQPLNTLKSSNDLMNYQQFSPHITFEQFSSEFDNVFKELALNTVRSFHNLTFPSQTNNSTSGTTSSHSKK
jgi:hypothetical protein